MRARLRLIRAASRTICVGEAEFDEVESLVDSAARLVLAFSPGLQVITGGLLIVTVGIATLYLTYGWRYIP